MIFFQASSNSFIVFSASALEDDKNQHVFIITYSTSSSLGSIKNSIFTSFERLKIFQIINSKSTRFLEHQRFIAEKLNVFNSKK
jgi:hypothetical protein